MLENKTLNYFELIHTYGFWKIIITIHMPLIIVILGIFYYKNSTHINSKVREISTWLIRTIFSRQ